MKWRKTAEMAGGEAGMSVPRQYREAHAHLHTLLYSLLFALGLHECVTDFQTLVHLRLTDHKLYSVSMLCVVSQYILFI